MSPSQLFAAGGPRRAAHPDRHLRTRRPPTPDRDARLPGSLPPPRGDAVSARGQAAAVARRRRHPARDAQRDHAAAGADAFVASIRATRPSGRGGRRAAQPPSLLPGGPTVTRRPYGMYRYTQGRASRSHLPFHFQVDEQFTTLRWSWTESLLLDEILSIDYSAGSTSFTIQYFQQDLTHGAAKISLSLVCRTIEDAARWVRALSGLQRVEAVQHNLDVSKRARLKRAFRTATKEPRLRLAQQIAFFSCTRPSEPDPPLTFDDRPTTCCFSPHPPRVESRCRTRAGLGACWAPCALRVPSPRFESRARGRRAAGVRQRHHAPAALWPARLVARPVEDLRSARGQPGGQGILPAGYEFMRPKGPHYPRFTISASHLLAKCHQWQLLWDKFRLSDLLSEASLRHFWEEIQLGPEPVRDAPPPVTSSAGSLLEAAAPSAEPSPSRARELLSLQGRLLSIAGLRSGAGMAVQDLQRLLLSEENSAFGKAAIRTNTASAAQPSSRRQRRAGP